MPLRRLGAAASVVAAMAGDHGSRSSRPRLKKPKKMRCEMHGEIEGRTAKLTKGEMETEAARRRLSARRGGRRSSETSGRRL